MWKSTFGRRCDDDWQLPEQPYVTPKVQRDLFPSVSGNTINGLGEASIRPPILSSTTTLGARILVRSKRGFVAFRDIR